MALVIKGLSSKALLYAAHPGTAPPRIRSGSRNKGLPIAWSLWKVDGLTMAAFLVKAGSELTPKALTAKEKDKNRVVKSFIFGFGNGKEFGKGYL